MNPDGPIIIIEDDAEEAELLQEVISSLRFRNAIMVLQNPLEAMACLRDAEQPYMVLSGINLKLINGFKLREAILQDEALTRKCVPYIFYSAHATEETRQKVYDLKANGYFHDINDYNEMGDAMETIIRYWDMSSGLNTQKPS